MPPAAGPSQEILEARGTYTFEIPASEHDHQDILLSAPGQTTPPPEYQRDPLSYDADIPSSRNERSKLKTPLDGARPSNLIGRFKNRCRNLTHAPKLSPRENERHSLNRSRYIPVIQIHPKGRAYPLYNLEAKLGERDSYNSIEFQCSGSSSNSSSFRQITLEIQLFHLDKPRTPIAALDFHPLRHQRTNHAEVQHTSARSVSATLGGGGAGVSATIGAAAISGVQYTRNEGVSFDGKRLNKSKLTWMWKAGDCVETGLEDPCEFWVTIPPVKKGVKADFKITCLLWPARPWGYKQVTLPDDKTKPVHELELHFT